MAATKALAPGLGADQEALGALLERSLRGDLQALEVLITLLRTRHYKRILDRLHHSRRKAGTQTLEDAFQDTVLHLVERIRSGELRDLGEKDRGNVLGYIFKLCDRRVADLRRPRVSPANARDKSDVPSDLIDSKAVIPGEMPTTERHRRHLASAMARLDPLERRVLECHLAGVPYRAISEETGKSEAHLAVIIARIKEQLIQDIVPRSPTAKLKYEEERQAALRTPTAEEVKAAVEKLPPELKRAVVAVHYEGKTVQDLAALLGDRGSEKALVRLKQACRILSTNLKAEFPKAFQELSK